MSLPQIGAAAVDVSAQPRSPCVREQYSGHPSVLSHIYQFRGAGPHVAGPVRSIDTARRDAPRPSGSEPIRFVESPRGRSAPHFVLLRRGFSDVGSVRGNDSLRDLIEAGSYRAVVDRIYPCADVVDATGYDGTEQGTGNVVLCIVGPGS